MKKLFLSFAVIASVALVSCGNKAENAEEVAEEPVAEEVVEEAAEVADSVAADTVAVVEAEAAVAE